MWLKIKCKNIDTEIMYLIYFYVIAKSHFIKKLMGIHAFKFDSCIKRRGLIFICERIDLI
jgi:hypothetical protein